jgi:hypothetical protein
MWDVGATKRPGDMPCPFHRALARTGHIGENVALWPFGSLVAKALGATGVAARAHARAIEFVGLLGDGVASVARNGRCGFRPHELAAARSTSAAEEPGSCRRPVNLMPPSLDGSRVSAGSMRARATTTVGTCRRPRFAPSTSTRCFLRAPTIKYQVVIERRIEGLHVVDKTRR